MEPFRFTPGDTPLLISMPHPGTRLPPEIADRLTPAARAVPDTDWHVERLYDFALELGASVLAATHSRYLVDLNRDPAGTALYPGAENTAVCPTTTFDRAPIYREGTTPTEEENADRVGQYWRPYHNRLRATLVELRNRFGVAVLFDAHSIRSVVPRFFEGTLPDFNLGTASGTSCDQDLSDRIFAVLQGASGYSSVRDGRFTGGYITRHYGAPGEGIHAVQLELSQRTYMDEGPPFTYRLELADRVRPVLRDFVTEILRWSAETARG
ncbi:MAG: N-formylglutamate deformylase [Alphaproteobacteria bacterium]|nr:N-formylglutamate deformylase [Alphaproteobacteria bacterium]